MNNALDNVGLMVLQAGFTAAVCFGIGWGVGELINLWIEYGWL